MQEFFDKYKYYIGGSTISIILFFIIYNNLVNIDNKELIKPKKEKNNIKTEISHEEFLLFMKTLKNELQNLTQSMMEFNANHIKTHSNYKNFRDKIFTKDIIKKNIIVDSISSKDDNTSNYIINFGGTNTPEVYKNVIGFRLINACFLYTFYTVTDNNNKLNIDDHNIEIPKGSYLFEDLAMTLQAAIREQLKQYSKETDYNNFSVLANTDTLKYTINSGENDDAPKFTIGWPSNTSTHRLFGFTNKMVDGEKEYTSVHIADHSIHYIDLVIKEIPSIACKITSKGQEIIARLPFNTQVGSVIQYRAPEGELQTNNYFYPMKLNQLSIQLFDDHGGIYDSNNGDNSFEFELTIIKNTDLFK